MLSNAGWTQSGDNNAIYARMVAALGYLEFPNPSDVVVCVYPRSRDVNSMTFRVGSSDTKWMHQFLWLEVKTSDRPL
jgi:hypothetical protein